MITMKEIKNAANPTAKAIDFIEWKAEIAENKMLWKNPTNDPEADMKTIMTFVGAMNNLLGFMFKAGIEVEDVITETQDNVVNYLHAIMLAGKDRMMIREKYATRENHGRIVEFKVPNQYPDEMEEAEIINKMDETAESFLFGVDFEAKQMNGSSNKSVYYVPVMSVAEGFYAVMSTKGIDKYYSERVLSHFIEVKNKYTKEAHDIVMAVRNCIENNTEYAPVFNKYGVRI